jgi:putative ABC transport system permease protein
LTPRDRQARQVRIPAVGVTMTRKLADLLAVHPGDLLLVKPIKGLRQIQAVPVVEISDSYVGLSIYADINYLSRLIGEEMALTGVELQTDPRSAPHEELLKELKEMPALESYSARANAIRNLVETALKAQMIFIVLLTLFAGVIFFCSMLNTSLIALAERQREVATMRVMGYTEYQVGGYFLRESFVINALGTLLGLPLGYALTLWLTYVRFDTEMFRFPLVSPPLAWLGVIGLAIVFCLAAHGFVQRAINRLDWREALNVKE